jgi:phenylacetate-CoA ligase
MRSGLLSLYHALPPSLRSLAATLRGYQLRRLRYGPDTERLVAEALDADHLPPAELDRRAQERLRYVLERAARTVPYYRQFWQGPGADGRDPTRLADWPILEKETLRVAARQFLVDGCDPAGMIAEHSSGTTGKPLGIWWSRAAARQHYALFEARWRRWYGVSRHDRWAMLGGQLVAPVRQRKPPFWVWNAALGQLYMSSYHLAKEMTPHYLDALKRYRVRYLWGYSSALYALAQDALATGRDDLRMVVAITNAEPLYAHQRQAIGQAFQCPVRETYGMSELVAAASECEAGCLHLWPETGVVEVLDGDRPLPVGETGDLVCTGLINVDMPLVRYRVGDRGALDDGTAPCPCGRTLPRLKFVEGRSDDVLFTSDGRRVGRLDTVFKSDWPIREAQIIQQRLDLVCLRYVPGVGYTDRVGRQMVAELRERLGDVRVQLESMDAIPRTSNGKFRAVLCNLPADERRRLNEAIGTGS